MESAGQQVRMLPEVADLRMPAAGVAAWLGGLGGLLAPVPALIGGAVLGLVAWCTVQRPGLRRALLVWLLVAMAVGASAFLRDLAVQRSAVASLATTRAAAVVELTITSDPRAIRGEFSTSVAMRASVDRFTSRGATYDVHTPVLLIADESWSRLALGTRLTVDARLGPVRGHDVAAVLIPRGEPHTVRAPSMWWRGAGAVRASIRQATAVGPAPARDLVPALVDGDDSGLPEAVQDDFRVSGLTHLLAVSGTNLTLVVGFLLLVGRWCGVRGRWLHLLGAAGIVGFVLLARTEPSVVRAAAMGTVALLGMGANGTGRGVRAIGVAVVGLLLLDPWLAVTVGFALSVLATAGILLFAPVWAASLSRWMPMWAAQALAVPTAAQLACTPVVAAISGQVSLVAVVANLVAGPLVAPATILGLAGGLLGLAWPAAGQAPGWAACQCAQAIIAVAEHSAGAALPAIDWGSGGLALVVLTALCVLLAATLGPLLARPSTGVACVGVMLIVVLVPLPTPGWPPQGWVMVACDVGQGDGLVLNAGDGRAVVVDVGPEAGSMDRCLDRLGVSSLPLVVLTHFHADHVDGLDAVLSGHAVAAVLVSALAEPSDAAGAVRSLTAGRTRVPMYGEVLSVGEVRLQVLGPVPGTVVAGDPNNASLVLLVEVRGVRILLTGDVEPDGQQRLAASYRDLNVDVLKVPHHGSRHQDMEFLLSTTPSVAVASVGEGNDYGHPAASTMDPLADSGARVLRTDRDGDVAVVLPGDAGGGSTGESLEVRTHR